MEYLQKYIHVSFLGTITGISVSAITYSTMLYVLQHTALGTDLLCNIVGEIFKIGTTYLCGDIAGQSVKLIIKHIGHTSKNTIDINSHIVAGATALTAGTIATVSVVIGEYIIYYGIEYGGKITQEVVHKISQSAFKLTHQLTMKTPVPLSLSDDWVLIGPMDYNPFDSYPVSPFHSDSDSDSDSDSHQNHKKILQSDIPRLSSLDDSLFPIVLE